MSLRFVLVLDSLFGKGELSITSEGVSVGDTVYVTAQCSLGGYAESVGVREAEAIDSQTVGIGG